MNLDKTETGGQTLNTKEYKYFCENRFLGNLSSSSQSSHGEINKDNVVLPSVKPVQEISHPADFRDFFKKRYPQTTLFTKPSTHVFHSTDFLLTVAPNISEELISPENLAEIHDLARHLKEGVTSFFGFEFRLMSNDARSDYLIAVSSKKREREALLETMKSLPEKFLQLNEWHRVKDLTEKWMDPNSILHDRVLGIWLEFDTTNKGVKTPVPNVFLQTIPLRIDESKDVEKCSWVTRVAIPLLTGSKVSKKLENKFFEALEKLPKHASVFHVASMIARDTKGGIRLVIKRIKPEEIIPYLESLGWRENSEGKLKTLLDELKNYSNCIRLHINISDHVHPKVGLECFISPERYHEVDRWEEFFDYLVSKNLCLPNLRDALLGFPGVTQEDLSQEFTFESYVPSVKIEDNGFSKALVRYISHVKISYDPKSSVEAKAYIGVRLFSRRWAVGQN
ncbi:MAG TPA: hypothetical protein EYP23_02000 [Thermoplasmata archaeon]|nr:hypothetical protein [Thermoplasmata archaeon]